MVVTLMVLWFLKFKRFRWIAFRNVFFAILSIIAVQYGWPKVMIFFSGFKSVRGIVLGILFARFMMRVVFRN